jgi:hypothetical protein
MHNVSPISKKNLVNQPGGRTMRSKRPDTRRKFSMDMWAKWQKDREPDAHTEVLRKGIAEMRATYAGGDYRKPVGRVKAKPTKDQIRERAQDIDPAAWDSYSGKPIAGKREMHRRRLEAMRKAEDDLNTWKEPA